MTDTGATFRSEAAFGQLAKRFGPRLRLLARRLLGSDDAAGDVVQDCLLRLWERCDELREPEKAGALLFTMVRRRCLNELRHRAVVDFRRLDDVSGSELERLCSLDLLGRADGPMLLEELQQALSLATAQLPERTQEVLRLSRDECLSNREIALRLGISMTSVEKHIRRAREGLNVNGR